MVINSSEEPKSKFTLFHSVKKEDISSAKLLETDKFYSNIKVYSRPSKGKNLTQILNLQYTKNLIYTGYFAVYSWKIFPTGMVSRPILFMESICEHK